MTEERKLVTVLFADIVGSTEIGLEYDPELVRAAFARAFAGVRAVLVAHGGTVEKFIGDAVMAVFGVPVAHEDDADRAVRAAFALRDRVVLLQGRVPLQVVVGINTGEAVAGLGAGEDTLVTGTPVIGAARLQQAATAGEILVGATTRSLTHGGVSYATPRSVAAKGFGSLEAWPAVALESALPQARRGLGPLRAPLIGRAQELHLLEEAVARVRSQGSPGLVTVFGPAGAGKSRLASEFVARAGHDRVRMGRCLPYGEGVTFYPLQLMVRAECDIDPADDHAAALAKLARTAAAAFDDPGEAESISARVAAAVGLVPAGEALPDVPESAMPEELRYGLRRFFERRAGRDPLVLVFEDLHWAAPALVDLIEHLAEWSRAPLLLLCLARSDFRDAHPRFGAEAANASTVTLPPLRPEETRLLVAELLALEALPESLRAEVVDRAEGNPLYVEEFLRLLIETGRIGQREGRWEAIGAIDRLEVPPTLIGLVSARLDRVAPEVKQILQRASIVGRIVSTAGLEAIGGAPVAPEVLREAVRRDLLAEADERALGAGRVYRFKHLLTRDVAYSTVPKAERARLHDNYGHWMETILGDRREEAADLIAFHSEQAFNFSNELAEPDAGARGARALDWLLLAAARARRRGEDSTALAIYERAVRVAEAFPSAFEKRVEAVGFAALMHYRRRSASTPGLDEDLARGIELAGRLGPSEVLVELLDQAALSAVSRGRAMEARAFQDRMLRTAEAAGDTELSAHALVQSSTLHYFLGDPDRERSTLEAALTHMRAHGAKRELVRSLLHLASLEAWRGAFTAADGYVREAEQSRATWSKADEQTSAQRRGNIARWAGDLETALRWCTEAHTLATELGQLSAIGLTAFHIGEVRLRQRLFAEARDVMLPAADLFERRGQRQFIPEVRARLCLAYVGLGDLVAARESLVRAQQTLLQDDEEAIGIAGLAAAALAEAEGRADEAERVFRETIKAMDRYGRLWSFLARVYIDFGAFLIRRGQLAEAREVLGISRTFHADPLAFRQVERIDALLSRAAAPA